MNDNQINDMNNNMSETTNNVVENTNLNGIDSSMQPSPPMEEITSSFEMTGNPYGEEKKGINKFIIIGIVAVVVVIAVIVGIMLFSKKEQSVSFKTSIDNQVKMINNLLKDAKSVNFLEKAINNKLTLSGTLDFDTDVKELKEFTKYKLDYKLGYDSDSNIMGANIVVNDDKDNSIDVSIQLENNYAYMNLGDIFDKTISVPLEEVINVKDLLSNDNSTELSNEDVMYLLNNVVKSFLDNIDESKVTKESVKEDVFGSELELNKMTYKLTKEEMTKLFKDILDNLMNDDKAIDILASLSTTNKTELIDNLKKAKDKADLNAFDINLYVNKKGELVITELVNNNSNKITVTSLDNKLSILFINDGEKIDIEYIEGTSNQLNIKSDEGNIKLTIEDKSTDNKINTKLKVIVNVKGEENESNYEVNLTVNGTEEYSFEEINKANARKIDELTDEEIETLSDNMEKHPIIGNLITSITGELNGNVNTNTTCANATNCTACNASGVSECQYVDNQGWTNYIDCPCQ